MSFARGFRDLKLWEPGRIKKTGLQEQKNSSNYLTLILTCIYLLEDEGYQPLRVTLG